MKTNKRKNSHSLPINRLLLCIAGAVAITGLSQTTAEAQNYARLADNPRNSGEVNILVVSLGFADNPQDGSQAQIKNSWDDVIDIAEEYWIRNSYGSITNFKADYTPVFQMSYNTPQQADRDALLARTNTQHPLDAVMKDCEPLIAQAGFNIQNYDVILKLFKSGGIVYGITGSTSTAARPGSVNYTGAAVVVGGLDHTPSGLVHELGHAFGIRHPGIYQSTSQSNIFSGYSSRAEGLSVSMMGSGGVSNPYTNRRSYAAIDPVCRYGIGHLPLSNIKTVSSDQVVRIFDFHTDNLSSGKNVAAVINIPSGIAQGDWWLCFNPDLADTLLGANLSGTDSWTRGIGVFKRSVVGQYMLSDQLDFTPDSHPGTSGNQQRNDCRDGALVLGAEWTFPESTVRIKPISKGTQNGIRYIDVEVTTNPTYRYDMGTSQSPIANGFTRVTPSTSTSTFGWNSTSQIYARDRGAGTQGFDSGQRDLCESNFDKTFFQKVPNGTWDVKLTIGDRSYNHDNIRVLAEGQNVLTNVDISAGTIREERFSVNVSDGQLDITMMDEGGSDNNWVLNKIEITKTSETLRFDMGTAGSPVTPNYQRITPASRTGAYRWASGAVYGRDRGSIANNLDRDLCESRNSRTFQADVSNGTWRVSVRMGDPSYSHDDMAIRAEGTLVRTDVDRPVGQISDETFNVNVNDGRLDLNFFDRGGSDGNWIVNAIVLEKL